jgi:hypothetical protein
MREVMNALVVRAFAEYDMAAAAAWAAKIRLAAVEEWSEAGAGARCCWLQACMWMWVWHDVVI